MITIIFICLFYYKKSFILIVLFVCIKRQFRSTVEKAALESNSFYITQRWLGGMLTNWITIKACIEKLRFFCVLN